MAEGWGRVGRGKGDFLLGSFGIRASGGMVASSSEALVLAGSIDWATASMLAASAVSPLAMRSAAESVSRLLSVALEPDWSHQMTPPDSRRRRIPAMMALRRTISVEDSITVQLLTGSGERRNRLAFGWSREGSGRWDGGDFFDEEESSAAGDFDAIRGEVIDGVGGGVPEAGAAVAIEVDEVDDFEAGPLEGDVVIDHVIISAREVAGEAEAGGGFEGHGGEAW